jgi:hypothetical protein
MPRRFTSRSAFCPMVSPVEKSAIGGTSGARSRKRSPRASFSQSPIPRAFCPAIRRLRIGRLTRIGTSDSVSAPPATARSAAPTAMALAAF